MTLRTLTGLIVALIVWLWPVQATAQIKKSFWKGVVTQPAQEVKERTAAEASAAAQAVVPMAPLNNAILAGAAVVPPAGAAAAAAVPADAIAHPAAEVVTIVPRGKLLHVRLTAVQEREVLQELQAQLPATTQAITLPGLLRAQDEAGQELKLKAFAVPGRAMVYQASTGKFQGSVKVGVMSVDDRNQGRVLTAPVPFEILESGVANPALLRVERTGSPFQEAMIEDSPAGATYAVHVSSSFEPNGVEVALKVSPTLLLRTERQAMQGYGLETMTVYATLLGADPNQVASVELNADPSGFFEPKVLKLGADGRASATLRSDGTGPVRITATAGGLTSTPATVWFEAPTRTVAAGLIGGLAGGIVRLLPKRRRGQRWGRFMTGLLVAVLLGLGAFVLYAVGVNVLPIKPTVTVGSIVVVALSFVGALVWTGKFAEPQSGKPT